MNSPSTGVGTVTMSLNFSAAGSMSRDQLAGTPLTVTISTVMPSKSRENSCSGARARAVIVVVAVVMSPVTSPSATPVGLQLSETS